MRFAVFTWMVLCCLCLAGPGMGETVRAQPWSGGEASADRVEAAESESERLRRLAEQLSGQSPDAPGRPEGPARGEAGSEEAGARQVDEASEPLGEPAGEAGGWERPAVEERALGLGAAEAGEGGDGPAGALEDAGSWWLSTLTALGVVLGLIFLLRWGWLRLTGQPSTGVTSSPVVEVLSRTAVAPRNHVLLLRVGQRVLVVSDSSGGMRTLANVDDAEEVAELLASVTAGRRESQTGQFSQWLERFHGEHASASDLELGRDRSEHVVDRARDSVSSLLSRVRTFSQGGGGGG